MAGKRRTPAILREDVAPNGERPPDIVDGDETVTGQEEVEIRPVEDMPEAWQIAYRRAYDKGCTDKAARLFADSHERDFEPKDPGDPDVEIARLEARIAELKGLND